MELFIEGGHPLSGEVEISGAKNSVLPLICASILSETPTCIKNVPNLSDVENLLKILRSMNADVQWDKEKKEVIIDARNIQNIEVDHELVRKLRASFLIVGALIGKFGEIKFPFPGGCNIGQRPVDLHLKAFETMGIKHRIQGGYIHFSGNLKRATIFLDFPSVGATENAILAAVSAKGRTVILNGANEPETTDLINYLNQMGADIQRDSLRGIVINGGKPLKGTTYKVIPDRIEAGTWLLLSAMSGGEIKVKNAEVSHLENLIEKLNESGISVALNPLRITKINPKGTMTFQTGPYPSFPTDFQPQCTAMAMTMNGMHIIVETVFENRFRHVAELNKMGADIRVFDKIAIVYGGKKITGAEIKATDLRGGMAMVMAGLITDGETVISDFDHVLRGYDDLIPKLQKLGAKVKLTE